MWHIINGDFMDLSIRNNIIQNLKKDDEKSILALIEKTVLEDDELALPGLGVLFSLIWNDFSKKEKEEMAKRIIVGVHKML